jgi:hypothetical protein
MQMVDKIISLGFSHNQKDMTSISVMGCRNNGKSDKTPRRATSSLWDSAPAKLVHAGHSNQFRWAHTFMTNEINYAIWLDWMYSIPCKAWCPRAEPYHVVQQPCQRRSSEAPHQPLLPAMAHGNGTARDRSLAPVRPVKQTHIYQFSKARKGRYRRCKSKQVPIINIDNISFFSVLVTESNIIRHHAVHMIGLQHTSIYIVVLI